MPKIQKRIRLFLGLANYYKKFIMKFSKITPFLSNLITKKNKVLNEPSKVEKDFKRLKRFWYYQEY